MLKINEEEKEIWIWTVQSKTSWPSKTKSVRSSTENEEIFTERSIQNQTSQILQKFNKGAACHLSSDKYPKVLRRS
jgi:hypothetical protein